VAGATGVDTGNQHIAGALAVMDSDVARRATQQAMRLVMEIRMWQPAAGNVGRHDFPIGERGWRLCFGGFDLMAIAAAAGGFVAEQAVTMLLSHRLGGGDIVQYDGSLLFGQTLKIAMSGERTQDGVF
jgi:hypothetical protein